MYSTNTNTRRTMVNKPLCLLMYLSSLNKVHYYYYCYYYTTGNSDFDCCCIHKTRQLRIILTNILRIVFSTHYEMPLVLLDQFGQARTETVTYLFS